MRKQLISLSAILAMSATCAWSQAHPAEEMQFNNVAISVANIDESADWYVRVFGFKLISRTYFEPVSAEVAFLARDDIRIELLQVEGAGRVEQLYDNPPVHLKTLGIKAIVFDVPDLPAFSEFLANNDVTVIWANQVLNEEGLKSTLLRDLDGNLINVFGRN
jgi:catechol 2,3-dioxygenase-like lactoylglutathione lyase family enzyme